MVTALYAPELSVRLTLNSAKIIYNRTAATAKKKCYIISKLQWVQQLPHIYYKTKLAVCLCAPLAWRNRRLFAWGYALHNWTVVRMRFSTLVGVSARFSSQGELLQHVFVSACNGTNAGLELSQGERNLYLRYILCVIILK